MLVTACAHQSGKPPVLLLKVTAFMTSAATGSEIAAVRATLTSDRHVRTIVFVNQQDRYNEFKRLFGNNPEFQRSVAATDLAATFQFIDDSLGDAAKLAR